MIELRPGLALLNTNFVVTYKNNIPPRCIIATPHDGIRKDYFDGMFVERAKGEDGKRATHVRDLYTGNMTRDIVLSSYKNGFNIDMVQFQMHRSYIDANRPLSAEDDLDPKNSQTALDDVVLKSVYNEYYNTIDYLIQRSVDYHGKENILFIDFHGFDKQPHYAPVGGYDLILGTANKATVTHGNIDERFAEKLTENGYHVFLPDKTTIIPDQEDYYDAGQTTRYAARHFDINAIQIETHSRFRGAGKVDEGVKLANNLAKIFSLILG